MRLFIAATVAASLFATNLMAADAAAPLPAGKPAGVQKAQDAGDSTILWIVGAAALAAIAAAAASGGGNHTSGTSAATTS